MIALAHQLGIGVIAEGVELAAQRDTLVLLGCDQFQGYLYSRPVPQQEARAYLQAVLAG
ncbi:MAG: EAL domain-containing protein [Thauera sp.]|jgi:EAL domain-containing protein (putative c-di-GMP-specific phosphodiesterase class I)|nr:EAL domain-containing protein [Thauera sp.]